MVASMDALRVAEKVFLMAAMMVELLDLKWVGTMALQSDREMVASKAYLMVALWGSLRVDWMVLRMVDSMGYVRVYLKVEQLENLMVVWKDM